MLRTIAIPENTSGKQTDLFTNRSFHTIDECLVMFNKACVRLLDPGQWAALAGKEKATFVLFDQHGENPNRLLQVGDYLRIDLPGPGTSAGEGFDWVHVIKLDRQRSEDGTEELLAITMQPSHPPQKNNNPAHFFEKKSSSTLVVHRIENKITASHHGRNEVINNHTESLLDNIRNTMVAAVAKWGLSEMQWKALIEGLLSDL